MSDIQVRRRPSQARSRERFDLIVRTARDLIGERGNDAVSMREIAATAGVPIGSVYQYFPDKSTLLFTIMEEYYERIHAALLEELGPVADLDQLGLAVPRSIKRFVQFCQEETALANIWAGIQADPRLLEQDVRDSYRNAELFGAQLLKFLPGLRKSDIKPFTLFFTHTIGSLVRFSLVADENDGKALLKECQKLIELRIQDLRDLSRSRSRRKKK